MNLNLNLNSNLNKEFGIIIWDSKLLWDYILEYYNKLN